MITRASDSLDRVYGAVEGMIPVLAFGSLTQGYVSRGYRAAARGVGVVRRATTGALRFATGAAVEAAERIRDLSRRLGTYVYPTTAP